jgi:Spy/CpxP family protein refolding chaperone
MITRKTVSRALLLATLIAAPAAAQVPPPPSPPLAGMAGHHGGSHRSADRMFPSMSEAGRATIREAMMAGDDRRDNRQKVAAARDKLLSALEAERYDAGAVKRAMDEERALSEASREQRQSAMLAAFGKLSAADRKAFVTDSRAMKDRMGQRAQSWRERWRERRAGGTGDAAAPRD